MIKRKGNQLMLAPDLFGQLEARYHFPSDLLKKKLIGYVCLGIVYILYEDERYLIRVPFARSRLWFRAMTSEPELAVLARLPQIYIG